MKKFNFPLERVLKYKDQILDGLKNEHAKILMDIRKKEEEIARLEKKHLEVREDYNEEKFKGNIHIERILQIEFYLKSLDRQIKKENAVLDDLKLAEAKKREEVVRAKQDVQSLEKLKENKVKEYNNELRAANELILEEFISNRMVVL